MRHKYRPNTLFATARRHSEKPECSYNLIEELSFGPCLELFARKHRPGWTALGDEIDGLDIRDALVGLKQPASLGA
jgi:N6-adenosine-specific RNA methylase IME4